MSKYLQFKKNEKKIINVLFFLIISFSSFAQSDWVTWKSANTRSNQLQGSVVINGETVNVLVQVTSTDAQAHWYDSSINNDVIAGGDNWQVVATSLGSYQESLGVDKVEQMALLDHNYYTRPNILTITFDKPVVIETLSYADIDADYGMWTDGHTITGYEFNTVESGGFETVSIPPTITTSGVQFDPQTSSEKAIGTEYVRYHGNKLIQPSEKLVISYHSIVSSKNGRSAGNGHSGFAIKIHEAMGKISGKVLEDTTGDQQGNTGISNVNLSLYQNGEPVTDNNGNAVTTQTTSDGSYLFDAVVIGNYAVRQTNLNGYFSVSDKDGGNKDEILNIAVVAEQTNTENNFIDTKSGQLSGEVLEDLDGDTVGDKGIGGVSLSIKNTNGFSKIITTQADGSFQLDGLEPTTYTIQQTNANGFYSSADSDGTNDDLITTTVLPNQTSANHKFIDFQLATVKGTVKNVDGNGLATQIQLTTITGGIAKDIKNQNLEVTSSTDGTYVIENILPGDYIIKQIDLPNYYSISDEDSVKDGNDDSDINGSQVDSELAANLKGGEIDSGNNFVDYQAGQVKGSVQDDKGNGIQSVTITLKNFDNTVAKDRLGNNSLATTDSNGNYSLSNLLPGEYKIVQTDLDGYSSISDSDDVNDGIKDTDSNTNTNDNELLVKISNGEVDTGNNFVDKKKSATVSGSVKDTDGNSLENITVNIKTVFGQIAKDLDGNNLTLPTNAQGKYLFENIPVGNYVIEVNDIDGYKANSDSDVVQDSTDDSDLNGSQIDKALPVDLIAGEVDTGNQFVFKKILPASIKGIVYNSLTNGGIENVFITLKTQTGEVAKDLNGQPVTTKTNANGSYTLSNLAVGSYIIEQTDLAGYVSVKDEDAVNDGALDSDTNTDTNNNKLSVELSNGEIDTGNHFYDKQTGSLSGVVLEDYDGNGTGDSGIENVTVTISNQGGFSKTVKTSTDGSFSISDLSPGNYLLVQTNLSGYFSKSDSDGINDDRISVTIEANKTSSGHQFIDYKTATVSGKVTNLKGESLSTTVQLETITGQIALDKDGNQLKTQSESDGFYTFNSILPGDYVIKQIDLAGYYSIQDKDAIKDSDLDNDINTSQVDSELAVRLRGGEQDTGNNFVDDNVSTVSGKVLDTDDKGLANVTLYLKNLDGSIAKDQSGAELKVLTNTDGAYIFQNVVAGEYYIEQVNLPTYFSLLEEDVTKDGGSDDDIDSAGNDNKLAVKISSGLESDSGNYFVDYQVGKISGTVKDEKGNNLSGISITVKDPDGAVVKNRLNQDMMAVTSSDGRFEFTDVRPGSFTIEAIDKDDYFSVSDSDDVNDEIRDTDKNENTNDNKLSVQISTGEIDTGNNFIDQLKSATIKGQVQEFAGKGGLANVVLTLKTLDDKTAIDLSGQPLTTKTLADGTYTFSNIPVGSYYIEQIDLDGYFSISDGDMVNDGADDNDENTNTNNNRISVALVNKEIDTGNNFVDQLKSATVKGQVQEFAGKGGLANVVLTLKTLDGKTATDTSGQPLTTKTLTDGTYTLTNIPVGSYYIEQIDLDGYVSVSDGDTVNDGADDNDINTNTNNNRIAVALVNKEIDTGNVFIDQKDIAGVSGTVKTSKGLNLAGIEVSLFDANGQIVKDAQGQILKMVTGADGKYSFMQISSGIYSVQVGSLLGYTFVKDSDETNDGSDDVDTNTSESDKKIETILIAGEIDTGNNFYYKKWAVVKGTVKDADGSPVEGATISIKDVIKNSVVNSALNQPLTTNTKADGTYSLYYIPAGDYFIESKDLDGYVSKSDNDEIKDSDEDVDPNGNQNDNVIPISLAEGEIDTGNNFVDISTTTITGGVMTDTNNDGVGDKPLSGVKVKLLDQDKNPVLVDSSNPTTRNFTQKELIATTNEQGIYTFYNVAPGTYYLQQIQPDNYTSMGDAQGDGTDNLIQLSIAAGQQVTGQNFIEVESRALPVDLVSFTAQLSDNSVHLKWITAAEKENSHFGVERSMNGIHFNKVGEVKGVGTSTKKTEYIYIDENITQYAPVVYYRLKQIDLSGAIEYSSIVSVQLPNEMNQNQFVVYPNPVKSGNIITIEFKSLHLVQIYNLQGQLQKEIKTNQVDSIQISTENLSAGEYIVTLNGIESKTIVITK